ncbi:hypothetical protein [Alteraurantiacibacter buctensis]|uniref:DUF429 domain-containing protein n=1 Tax=Alteraurantiacibacter buctensis TaxID=1503981 RepID=A0A844Z089_9SPHN|nr:hypothetical protein [Alteraurantiacibacter buctensis]MXO72902.1 hypothetical protein [Alteraurantiacibacter buctensis]
MSRFQYFLAVDWSGARGQFHKGIALALAHADGGPPVLVPPGPRGWSRSEVLDLLRALPGPTLVGMDLGISLPFADCGAFFPGWEESPEDARALWALVDRLSAADPHFAADGFVSHPLAAAFFHHGAVMGARYRCDGAEHRSGRLRITEVAQRNAGCRPHSNFKLVGNGQVGKSSLTGMRVLHALAGAVPVWPVDPDPGHGSLIVEMYTAIPALAVGRKPSATKFLSYEALNEAFAHPAIASPALAGSGPLTDHEGDALLTAAWLRRAAHRQELWQPQGMTGHIARTEGWTFGVA